MSAAGSGDRNLAEELAAAVGHFLAVRHHDPLELDAIEDMIERVLMETGHRTIARHYVLLRAKRARVREQIEVRRAEPGVLPVVEGRRSRLAQQWERGRISRALIEEADLGAEEAAAIARAVEDKVLRAGIRAITTSLVRELVDNELFERGLTQRLRRQGSVAVPKYDLERVLYHGGDPQRGLFSGSPARVASLVGDLLVRQFVVEEVYSPEVLAAHHAGVLCLHDLDSSLKALRLELPASSLLPSRAGVVEEGIFWREVFRRVRALSSAIAEEISVTRLGEGLFVERQHSAVDPARSGRHFAASLAELQRWRAGLEHGAPALELCFPFVPRTNGRGASGDLFAGEPLESEETSLFLVQTLYQMLAQLPELHGDPAELLRGVHFRFEIGAETFRERRFLNALWGVLDKLPADAPASFEVLGAGAGETERARVLGGRVTMNLARIAGEAAGNGPGGGTPAAFEARAALAARALAERAEFLRRISMHPDGPLGKLQDEIAAGGADIEFTAGIAGLDDAVRALTGLGLHEGSRAEAAGLELIDRIRAALVAAESDGAPPLRLEESAGCGPVRRTWGESAWSAGAAADSSRETCVAGVRQASGAPIDPVASWLRLAAYRRRMRLDPRLDDCARLRADGTDVMIACLQEITRRQAGAAHSARRSHTPPDDEAFRPAGAERERDL